MTLKSRVEALERKRGITIRPVCGILHRDGSIESRRRIFADKAAFLNDAAAEGRRVAYIFPEACFGVPESPEEAEAWQRGEGLQPIEKHDLRRI